ncbi:MAG: RNA 2',3'-cyclic phosphodiesterase [Candidatus Dormiibacterota bacterium]
MSRASAYFLAIEIGGSLRRALTPLLTEMTDMGAAVRPVRTDSLHVTLRYLGRLDPAQQVAVRAAAAQVASAGRPFTLALTGIELAPPGPSPRVVWAPLGEGEEDLVGVVARLNLNLADRGWANPTQPFKAHCTLARLSPGLSLESLTRLQRLGGQSAAEPSLKMPVEALCLMESLPVPGQANRYRRRANWSLKGE